MSPRLGWKRVGKTLWVLVLVGVVGYFGITVLLSPRYPDAREVVKDYFAALARGDAAAALSYGENAPESTEFLTDEILRKQIAAAPIADVTVVSSKNFGRHGHRSRTTHVEASVNFGGTVQTQDFPVTRGKLQHAAVKLERFRNALQEKAMDTVTISGKPAGGVEPYVFPGALQIGSDNPNVIATTTSNLVGLTELHSGSTVPGIRFALSDYGHVVVESAVAAAVAECGKSRLLAPPDCPQRVGIHGNALVDGTVSWGEPDLSAMKLTFNERTMTVRFDKMTEFPLTVTTTSGESRSRTTNSYVGGKVDIAQDPPRVTFG